MHKHNSLRLVSTPLQHSDSQLPVLATSKVELVVLFMAKVEQQRETYIKDPNNQDLELNSPHEIRVLSTHDRRNSE
jgi:hypothetical protein